MIFLFEGMRPAAKGTERAKWLDVHFTLLIKAKVLGMHAARMSEDHG